MKTRQNRPPRNTAWIKLGRIARGFSFLGLAACLHSCAPAAEEPPAPEKPAPGKTAPDFAMASLGGDITHLTNHPGKDWNPVWSPDGGKIALVSSRYGDNQIYIMNADGTDVTRFPQGHAGDWQLAWGCIS